MNKFRIWFDRLLYFYLIRLDWSICLENKRGMVKQKEFIRSFEIVGDYTEIKQY